MTKFRWAYIGSGRIANITANELLKSGNHSIITVYSRNNVTSEVFAKKYNCIATKTIEEAIDRKDIDAVYIATPKHVHFEHALVAINLKKPVFIEKPFVTNLYEAETLIRQAIINRVYLGEAMCMRYNPLIIRLGELSRKYGKPTQINVTYAMAQQYLLNNPTLLDRNLAGGALLEIGLYGMYLSNYLQNESPNVLLNKIKIKNGVDITSNVRLVYDDCVTELYTSLSEFRGFPKASIMSNEWNCKVNRFSAPRNMTYQYNRTYKECVNGKYIHEFDCVSNEIRNGLIQPKELSHNELINNMICIDRIMNLMNK